MIYCKTCAKPLSGCQTIFCSRSCAAKTNNLNKSPRSKESKLKTRQTINRRIAAGEIKHNTEPRLYVGAHTKLYGLYNCHCCNIQFWRLIPDQKCCSISCRDNIRSQNKCRKTQINYFNHNEGKNVILQSTWEFKIAQWLDDNNIRWYRPVIRFKWYDPMLYKYRTYLPDFYLPDNDYYLDVKNPIKMEEDKIKLSILTSTLPLFIGNIEQVKEYVVRLTGLEPACIH